MLKTLLTKEILEAIISLRFLVATLLCLVLIPLGMYVNLKEYEQRLADYQEATRLYQRRAEGSLGPDFQAEGYRPPSILSIFSVGLEYFLPNKMVTSRTGYVHTSNESGVNNPQSLLFGKVDLLFNVSFVISLLALVFAFNAITGEKEDGTLRLIMANPVPRWQILVAKLVGNYVVLLVPFLLALLIAFIVLNTSEVIPLFSASISPSLVVILSVTLLFILSMFNLGILVSTLTHRSITSIVVLLFLWTVLVLSVPKISPMIAEIVYPVKSQQVLALQKLLVRQNLGQELNQKKRELWQQLAPQYGFDPNNVFAISGGGGTEQQKAFMAILTPAQTALEQEYEQRINAEIGKLEQEDTRQRTTQATIAMNLSRLSPVSCYSYLISEISATGVLEMSKFVENANRFQQEVKENLYDKVIVRTYVGRYGQASSFEYAKGFHPPEASVPQLHYQHTTLSEALKAEWTDLLLLVLFNMVLFAASHVSFLRYDVR